MRVGSFERAGGTRLVGRLDGDRVRVLAAPDMVGYLAGDGRDETGEAIPFAELRVLAPVPDPPSIRDFYAFEGHVAAGARRRGREIAP